jgi:hypothetical protein
LSIGNLANHLGVEFLERGNFLMGRSHNPFERIEEKKEFENELEIGQFFCFIFCGKVMCQFKFTHNNHKATTNKQNCILFEVKIINCPIE